MADGLRSGGHMNKFENILARMMESNKQMQDRFEKFELLLACLPGIGRKQTHIKIKEANEEI